MSTISTRVPSPKRSSGFALLTVLVVFLLLATTVTVVVNRVVEQIRLQVHIEQVVQARVVAESALHSVLYDLITDGKRSAINLFGNSNTVRVAGQNVDVRVTMEAGKFDLRSPDLSRLLAFLFELGGESSKEHQQVVGRIRVSGLAANAGGISALLRKHGLVNSQRLCLMQYVTLYNDRQQPVVELAVNAIREFDQTLNKPGQKYSALRPRGSLEGNIISLQASYRLGDSGQFFVRAVVLLSGDPRDPYWILEWDEGTAQVDPPGRGC